MLPAMPTLRCALLLCCFASLVAAKEKQKVILILVDGSRWDYLNDPQLKAFPEIARKGVKADYVTPIFPSNSYPNWYTIVTGRYAESHGFVQNIMYDMKTKEFFEPFPYQASLKSRWWEVAEPLWVTAEKNGIKTGLYWWVGCQVQIHGVRPKVCVTHRSTPGSDAETQDVINKFNEMLDMFQKEELGLALVHYGPVDYTGHYSGPDSSERKRALYDIDKALGSLLSEIERRKLENEVNVVIVSDHGMTRTDNNSIKVIEMEPYSKDIEYIIYKGASSMILPQPGKEDKLYKDLKDANHPGLKVYKKNEIPDMYHIKNSNLVLPLLVVADKGYYIQMVSDSRKTGDPDAKPFYNGSHGYDPYVVEDMRTIFLAKGPSVKKDYRVPKLENIDHYNLLCYMLGLTPLPNNGSVQRVKPLVDDEEAFLKAMDSAAGPLILPSVILMFLSLFALLK